MVFALLYCIAYSDFKFCPLPLNWGGGLLLGCLRHTKKGEKGECGQSGHTPLVYTAACHAAWRDSDWTMPDALYRGCAGCSSLREVVVELVVVLIVVLISLPSDELLNTYNAVVLPIVIVNP